MVGSYRPSVFEKHRTVKSYTTNFYPHSPDTRLMRIGLPSYLGFLCKRDLSAPLVVFPNVMFVPLVDDQLQRYVGLFIAPPNTASREA